MKLTFKLTDSDKNRNSWYIGRKLRTIGKSINFHLFIDNSSQVN